MSVMFVPSGRVRRFGSMPEGSRVHDEEFFSHKADGSRVVRERSLLDMKGRQRPFPILGDHIEPVEEIGDGSIRGESGQLGSPDNADTHCVSGDPLDGVSGRDMVPSVFSRVVGGRGLSRNVPSARCFPSQDVGECTEMCVHGPDALKMVSAKNASDDSFPPRSSEAYKRDRKRI